MNIIGILFREEKKGAAITVACQTAHSNYQMMH